MHDSQRVHRDWSLPAGSCVMSQVTLHHHTGGTTRVQLYDKKTVHRAVLENTWTRDTFS